MTSENAAVDEADALCSGPGALYDLVARRLRRRPGYDLLTVLAPNAAGDRLVRLFSSDLNQYPLGDADIIRDSKWLRRLFVERAPVIANEPGAILAWLPDFPGLAVGSLVNLPVVIAGESIGLINLTAAAGHFSDDNVGAVCEEIPLVALAILGRRKAELLGTAPKIIVNRAEVT